MNKLHPNVKWLFRLKAYPILLFIGSFATGIFFSGLSLFLSPPSNENLGSPFLISLIIVLFYFSFIIIVAEIYARMSYNRWLYEITDEGIKIEHGIIWKKYTSIPFEKIQNVDIHRGIIARMFGFSSIEIETAGHSGFSRGNRRYHSEGYLPAIDVVFAEKIREFIIRKIKQTHREKSGI